MHEYIYMCVCVKATCSMKRFYIYKEWEDTDTHMSDAH